MFFNEEVMNTLLKGSDKEITKNKMFLKFQMHIGKSMNK